MYINIIINQREAERGIVTFIHETEKVDVKRLLGL